MVLPQRVGSMRHFTAARFGEGHYCRLVGQFVIRPRLLREMTR
jgi:hypothetical protein